MGFEQGGAEGNLVGLFGGSPFLDKRKNLCTEGLRKSELLYMTILGIRKERPELGREVISTDTETEDLSVATL